MVRAGEKFGNYQVSADSSGKIVILSETPDSITVRGEHSQLGTPVAIKILHHPTQGKEAFAEEVRVAGEAAGLMHPHIARVLDFGSDDHELYRVTEWCDGGDLKASSNSAPEVALKEWFLQAAEALASAHREGICHGDLQLSKLLIASGSGDPILKVTGFGFGGALKGSKASDAQNLATIFTGLLREAPLSDPSWDGLLGIGLSPDSALRPADGGELLSLIREEFEKVVPQPPAPPVAEEILLLPASEPAPPPPLAELPPPVEELPPPLPAAVLPPPPPPQPVQATVPQAAQKEPPAYTPPLPPSPVSHHKKSGPVPAIAVLIVTGLLAGGGYLAWTRFQPSFSSPAREQNSASDASSGAAQREPIVHEAQDPAEIATSEGPPAVKVAPAPERSSTPVEPAASAPVLTEEQPKVLKVPGDATTIGGALARCPSDGTIEVNGGVYRESLLITRPVTILASGDATLEDDGKSPTLLIAKGAINVSIRGLVLRNAQTKGAGNPEETPALMLVASGAKVKMEKCTLEGGQGDGMTVADHGEVELTECRVMKNRGFGGRVSGGSSFTATQGTIQENGLGGLWVSNTGSRVILNEGAAVNRNSNNGIQATEGAAVQINGGGVSFNRTNGVIALDAGTKIELKESGLISDNGVNGIAMVNGATVSISSSKIERNQNYGILAERSGKLALSGAVLRSNSMAGVFFNEGGSQSCRIERSEFSDHSEFGAAFVGGEIFVSGCTFSENGGALLLGKDTKGEISGNSISPGPLASAIVREEAGEVKETNNTIR